MRKKEIFEKYTTPMSNIKKGDTVLIKDGSYMVGIESESYDLEHLRFGLSEHIFRVVDINVACPSRQDRQLDDVLGTHNNCIIKSLQNNTIAFCSDLNICKVDIDDWSVLDETNISLALIRDHAIDSILS